MKTIKLKTRNFFTGLFATVLAVALSFGAVSTVNAGADTTQYTSLGARYFHAENGTAESFSDKTGTVHTSYYGRTEITPSEAGADVTATFNGLVYPTEEMYIAFDNGSGAPIASSAVMSWRSYSDPTKVLNLVFSIRPDSGQGDSMAFMQMSFTDDFEIAANGEATVTGTSQKLMGLNRSWEEGSTKQKYHAAGYILPTGSAYSWSPIFKSDWIFALKTDGNVKVDRSTASRGNILDEAFLNASKQSLDANSDYAKLYTTEYATALITELAKGSIFSITWKNMTAMQAVHIRKINAKTYIDVEGEEMPQGDAKPYIEQTVKTLYAGESYKLSDLFVLRQISAATPNAISGYYNIQNEAWGSTASGGTTFNNAAETTVTIPTDATQYKIAAATSVAGIYTPNQYFTFAVEKGEPTVTAVENVGFAKGQTHDLTQYFKATYRGATLNYAFTLDGEPLTGTTYVSDGEAHTLGVTVTDSRGFTATATAQVDGKEIGVPATVEADGYFEKAVALPVPTIPLGTSYTLVVYDENDEELTMDAAYVFTQSGTYKIVYTVTAFAVSEPITLECNFTLTLRQEVPTITINGTYESSYLQGKTLTLLSATATDGASDYTVTAQAYKNSVLQTVTNGNVTLGVGSWEIRYVCTYGDGKTTESVCEFTVTADTEKPRIIIEGAYEETYSLGETVSVLKAVVSDNLGEPLTYEVRITRDGVEIALADEITLSEAGTYQIIYKAVDKANNVTEEMVQFTVKRPSSCGSTVSGVGIFALAVSAFALCKFRRKKDEN